MKGRYRTVAIFATIFIVVSIEATNQRELPTKFQNNYQPYVCEENSTGPHDFKCNLYTKCINNQLVLKQCEDGKHWDRTHNICTSPDIAKCPNYQSNVCEDGSYKSDDRNCDAYYKCINKQFVQKKCSEGLNWRRENNLCTDPEVADCFIVPACKEGSGKPHHRVCNLYYKCIKNQLVLKECENGKHWDRTHNICTTPDLAKCPNYQPNVCEEGSYKSDDRNCDAYYKCINKQFVQKKCSKGHHWRKENNLCTDPEVAGCSIVPVMCEEGSGKPHDSKCNLYYKCINNQLVLKECENGKHWDRTHNICTTPDLAKCPNYQPNVCEEGSYKSDDRNCDAYYKCINKQFVQKKCSKGHHWRKENNLCTDPEVAGCSIVPVACEEGSGKIHETECNLYYKCINNQLVLMQCKSGLHWDRIRNTCNVPELAKCPNNKPRVCNEGSYKPDDENCDVYYKCVNNQFVQKKCSNGHHWNQKIHICTDAEVAGCSVVPVTCEEGSGKPHDSECNLYYKCINNQLVLMQCKSGLHWDRIRNTCNVPELAKCPNDKPRVCNEGSYKPDDENCDVYYKCVNNQFVQKKCSNGHHWNQKIHICTDAEVAGCSVVPVTCEEGSGKPHDSECNLYYKCINNQLVLMQCKSGLHWDRIRNICNVPELAKCPNIKPRICNEGSYKPDDENCDVYYKCVNNQFVQKKCSNGHHWNQKIHICTDAEVAGCSVVPVTCEEGSGKPHDSECNLYYKCINNQLVLTQCSSGLHWDRIRNICNVPELAKCPNYVPKVCNEGSYKPDDKNCDLYYKCENNQFVQKKCSKGHHWNRENHICTDPEVAGCSIVPFACEEGSGKPHDSVCNLYYKCINNQLVLMQCSSGLHWDRIHNICNVPELAKCPNYVPKVCDEGSYKPNDKECYKYYKCKNNQWDERLCPNGLHWNRDHTICILPEEANCLNNPDTCIEGSYKPHNKECDKYYKCKNNQWDERLCPNGLHWNREHTICILPEEAKCLNYPGTCLEGSYEPNYEECDKYYKCQNNQWDLKLCPNGLHWNREHTICISPEEAECNQAFHF